MEKWLLLGLGQGIYKISLEHSIVPGNKEMLEKQKQKTHVDGNMPKEPSRELLMAKAGTISATK